MNLIGTLRHPRDAAGRAPAALRALVRGREIWLILMAAWVGVAAGILVTGISFATQLMHVVLYRIGPNTRLSSVFDLDPFTVAVVPAIGGLVLTAFTLAVMRVRKRPAVDPVEANALHGGRMSITDSVVVTLQTMISNGFGASVGLEAGYTQIASAVASKLGYWFRLRRNDMRVMVGAGAAAAIAAAFNAPLTGAFYGFELIIGTYSVATVAPVITACIIATLVARGLGAPTFPIEIYAGTPGSAGDYALFVVLGFICGLVGIVIMRAVTTVESLFGKTRIPPIIRPALGGAMVGGLALITPQVLSAGHGALHVNLTGSTMLSEIALLIVLKVMASAISLGSGFRGGLFFASLFLGALVGKLVAGLMFLASPTLVVDLTTAAVIGMTALTVAVVGGPLTMAFMALETTGDGVITGMVLAASLVSSVTVRELFGYSFSTWRLHLRGETIRSAHDVGWMRSLTAGRMMRTDMRTVRTDMPLAEFRNRFPLGSTQRVIALDEADRYAGIILVPEAHAHEEDAAAAAGRVADMLHYQGDVLLPAMNIKEAIAVFDSSESEALAVVDNRQDGHVIGLLTEAHAMRRYAEELEQVRRGLAGTV